MKEFETGKLYISDKTKTIVLCTCLEGQRPESTFEGTVIDPGTSEISYIGYHSDIFMKTTFNPALDKKIGFTSFTINESNILIEDPESEYYSLQEFIELTKISHTPDDGGICDIYIDKHPTNIHLGIWMCSKKKEWDWSWTLKELEQWSAKYPGHSIRVEWASK